jgi:hypothetical protein
MHDSFNINLEHRDPGGCNGVVVLWRINKQGEPYSSAEIGTFERASVELDRSEEDLISWKVRNIVVNKKLFEEFTAAKVAGLKVPALTIEFDVRDLSSNKSERIQLLTCTIESDIGAVSIDSVILFTEWAGSAVEYITLEHK